VRLWFGRHLIADYIGDPASAARHEAAMRRRFPGLDITNQPLGATSHEPLGVGRDTADRSLWAADYSPADLHR
jgi:hypothetical protein